MANTIPVDERRRFFRIDDTLGIYFQTIGDEEAKAYANEISTGSAGVDYLSHFDNRIHTLLDSVKVQSPIVAELVDLMNKKMNMVIQQLDIDAQSIQQAAYTLRQVNISACGLAFFNEQLLSKGQYLELDLVLYPSELTIKTLAKVISNEPVENPESPAESHFIRLNFETIKAQDQELLIQHIVKRQSLQLKENRQISQKT